MNKTISLHSPSTVTSQTQLYGLCCDMPHLHHFRSVYVALLHGTDREMAHLWHVATSQNRVSLYFATVPYDAKEHAHELIRRGFDTFLLDFDQTFVNRHFYALGVTPESIKAMNRGEFESCFTEPVYLRALLHELLNMQDIEVHIVSFGREDVIKTTVDRLLGTHTIGIHTPLTNRHTDYSTVTCPPNKNDMLSAIFQRRLSYRSLYIDDDESLLIEAEAAFENIQTLHSTGDSQMGFGSSHVVRFLRKGFWSTPPKPQEPDAGYLTPDMSRKNNKRRFTIDTP